MGDATSEPLVHVARLRIAVGRFEAGVMLPPPPPTEGLCGAPGGPESLLAMAEVTRAHHRITCPECRACLPTMPPIYVRRETDE